MLKESDDPSFDEARAAETPTRARLVLLSLLAMVALGLWHSRPLPPLRSSPPGGDINLFRAVVERMNQGEPYYPAMRTELIARGYPTASFFNWRPPGIFTLLSRAPRLAHATMLILAVMALAMTAFAFRNSPPGILTLAILLQIGAALFPAIPRDGLYMPETWAGILLLLSVLAYTVGAMRLAVAAAIAAACARELALPYVFVSIAFALQARRFDEVRWYVVGLLVFGVYYGAHIFVARSHIRPGDMFHTASWLAFGGWGFVIRTVSMGGWYLMLPLWTAAIGAVAVLASLWGPADRHLKAMVIIYICIFSIIGQRFNTYWGLMTGPVWGLATLYGVVGVRMLVRASMSGSSDPRHPRSRSG
jgi:hypothetical protein